MSLTEDVIAAVRAGIREQRYRPGEIYSVYRLADELGVSRSPVREAMLRLAEVGLVEIARNRGFRVVLPAPRDIAGIFGVRLALEVPAAARCARQPAAGLREALADGLAAMEAAGSAGDDETFWAEDRRLHDLLLRGAGNDRAARVVADLRSTTALLQEPTGRTRAAICAEHRPVVEAVLAGDADAAAAAMRDHLTSTGLLLMAQAGATTPTDPALRQVWAEVVTGVDATDG